MGECKTPTYVRKAQKNYYERLKKNPEKYQEYLEKRRNYLKNWRKNKTETSNINAENS
jgi:hypothetical protein